MRIDPCCRNCPVDEANSLLDQLDTIILDAIIGEALDARVVHHHSDRLTRIKLGATELRRCLEVMLAPG